MVVAPRCTYGRLIPFTFQTIFAVLRNLVLKGLRWLPCTGEGRVVPGAAGVVCAGELRKWLSGVQVAWRGYLPAVDIRGTQRAKVCLEEDSAISWHGHGNGVPRNVGFSCVEYVGFVVANEKNNVRALWRPVGGVRLGG